jgi:hypothetical protein
VNGYETDEAYDESYDEAWDESELESAFEDLEYDEARRRRRRRRPRRRDRVAVPTPPRPGGGSSANLQRDRQLAKAVNVVNDDVGDVAARQAKANADLVKLKNVLSIQAVLPRTQTVSLTRLRVENRNGAAPTLVAVPNPTGTPAAGEVDVATGVGTKVDLISLLLPMMMTKGIGVPPGRSAAAAGNDMMMLPLILILQQQQQTPGAAPAQPAGQTGGLDTTTLLLVMMMSGMMS